MTNLVVIEFLLTWGLGGALLFSLFVVIVFRTGLVYTARQEDGTLKKKIPWRGLITMGSFLILVLVYFVLANYLGLIRRELGLGFGELFLLNWMLYLFLFVFDTLMVDYWVLGRWRPASLKIPDAMGAESMRTHILKSLPVGTGFGLILALIVSLIATQLPGV